MSAFSVKEQKDIDRNKAMLEMKKMRLEKLSGFFYNLAIAVFTAIVLGVIVVKIQGNDYTWDGIGTICCGVFATHLFARIGYVILKRNRL